jgi:hypothetical protein
MIAGRKFEKKMKFIVWAPPFDEDSGGSIALHLLCHRLNGIGHQALLWPGDRPLVRLGDGAGRLWWGVRRALSGKTGRYQSPFSNRVARPSDLADAITVYPEIVSGNPLGSGHVVRWFLNRPGRLTGRTGYGSGELYFFYQDVFNDADINPDPDNRLTLMWYNDAYQDTHRDTRNGSCYLLRKGAGRTISHDLSSSVLIDSLSHSEKAHLFNIKEYLYSYDLYTMYATYAAACGCIPVIVPEAGLSKLDWYPNEEDRYGLAYGEEDIGWAIETRTALLDRLKARREAEDEMLLAFVRKCFDRFGDS